MRYALLATWVGVATGVLNFATWIVLGFSLTPAVIVSLLLALVGFASVRLAWWLATKRHPDQETLW